MSRVLIIAEHLNGQLNSATARCVACAQALSAVLEPGAAAEEDEET